MIKKLNVAFGFVVLLLMLLSFSSHTAFSQINVKKAITKKDIKEKTLPVPTDLMPRRISNNQIDVTWKLTGQAKNVAVILERSLDGKDFSNAKIFRLEKGTESFSDTEDLVPGKAHFYRVKVVNKMKTSPYTGTLGTILTRVKYFFDKEPPVESVIIKP